MKFFNNSQNIDPLFKKSIWDAGWDIRANEERMLAPGESAVIGTGIHMELDPGTVFLIRDRSGLGAMERLTTRAGVIDCNYRGEVKVAMVNENPDAYKIIKVGDRIAQGIVLNYNMTPFEQVNDLAELSTTVRGASGFGSSGVQ